MIEKVDKEISKTKRRTLGVHLTSTDTFLSYIFPEIKNKLFDYLWVDLYAGEGNLILPILDFISKSERTNFFENHIFLSDIQPEMVNRSIENAEMYNIPRNIAERNIIVRDNLKDFPHFLNKKNLPIFHITNPPYLYLGYIRKHKETEIHLHLFENENEGYQDLYQIAMINDLRANLGNMIYIIPSNFLFGASVSNKFRSDFLKFYRIIKMYIFETQIFEFTGTNICIGFFERKKKPGKEIVKFEGVKVVKDDKVLNRNYILKPEWKYRTGAEFDEFTKDFKSKDPLIVKYYLLNEDINHNKGNIEITVIDTNFYTSNEYEKRILYVNEKLKNEVLSNVLYVRTVDTGSMEGRAGLYTIKEDFNVDGIYVSKATYRTSPIQIFLKPEFSIKDQMLLKDYFNLMLEYFREKLDSEFMTTYKYSEAEYTRKYLGLTQVRKLIETFPIKQLNEEQKENLEKLIKSKQFDKMMEFLKALKQKKDKSNPSILTSWL